ncbi:DUF1259 domain-containing protein [Clostridium neuense]|uniref:DUF1259 domain-containing protein n=1 Tax=Clostridium neuense TaxID=1728934 RepID=A0ABW8TC81_9CLOT
MYISNDYGYCPYMKNLMREDSDVDLQEEPEIEATSEARAPLCQQFASILGGKVVESMPTHCMVEVKRKNLKASISGKPIETFLGAEISYQSVDSSGRALNLAETVVLQEELNRFLTILRRNGIDISAVHTHWIYDNPRLMYVHFQSIENPLNFARKVSEALKVLR